MDDRPIMIDGSQGEGGGQLLRSSLALSLLTGRPLRIDQIRAKRQKPGLRPQHLAAVHAAVEVGRAEVDGAAVGSRRLDFRPRAVEPGDFTFRVGTAGSATLVLQTVLPPLLLAAGESHLTLEGGTHNPLAPPFDFLARAYLPLIGRMGPQVEATLLRPGFYPVGGGQFTVSIRPAPRLARFELLERGPLVARRVRALLANLPRHIGERECQTIADRTGWPADCFRVDELRSARGPGNAVLIELESQHVTEVFCAFGRRGVRAEQVAQEALAEAEHYLAHNVPVGPHLADQLLLPLGIAAWQGAGESSFRTTELTLHATTHLDLLRQILGVESQVAPAGEGAWTVRIPAL